MADHYRELVQSLMKLGFLFKRQTERKQEVWSNRLTDQEVTFDRREVASSPTVAAAVLKEARRHAGKRAESAAPAGGAAKSGKAGARAAKAKGRAKTKATAKRTGAAKTKRKTSASVRRGGR
jgi:hypothetical protein